MTNATTKVENLAATVGRLRELRGKARENGLLAGACWAKYKATLHQLRRVTRLAPARIRVGRLAGFLYELIETDNGPHSDVGPEAVFNFWAKAIDDFLPHVETEGATLIEDLDFARGFVEAAQAVWNGVRAEVESDLDTQKVGEAVSPFTPC